MAQIWMTLGKRLARAGLGLVLVGVPLLYCLLFLANDVELYASLMVPPGANGKLAVVVSYAWPILLGGSGTVLLLLAGRYLLRRWPLSTTIQGQPTLGSVVRHLMLVLALTYALGSVVHLLLPLKLLYFYDAGPATYASRSGFYWWPLPVSSREGWTIYPPMGFRGAFALLPLAEAVCIKLGALLATLLLCRPRSQPALAGVSAKSVKSV